VFGSIFIGAVHDFGALVISLRNNGQSVGDIAGRLLNRRVRLLFLFVLFLALTIVLAIFGLVIAAVFRMYPAVIFPCIVQIPIAIVIGLWLHRKGVNLTIPSLIALGVMYLTVIFGDWGPLHAINQWFASWPTIVWVAVLLGYSYVASVLPVWTLLQPRDYINSLQLLTALGLVVVGLIVAASIGGAPPVEGADRQPLEIVAPAFNFDPADAPLIFPFLFITIACGAISGFHCLVSSGTSSKQLQHEPDARFVGYGSMLTEGFLATIVILACVAGLGLGSLSAMAPSGGAQSWSTAIDGKFVLTGQDAFAVRYESWSAASGLGAKVGAFVDGAGNFLKAMGIPAAWGIALMGVLVASFAGTTLDTACRLQRYVVQELAAALLGRREPDAKARPCVQCGYDLRDNVSGSCPECGWQIDPAAVDAHIAQPSWLGSGAGVNSHGNPAKMAGLYNPVAWLQNKHVATIFAVVVGLGIAALPAPGAAWSFASAGTGGMILWPMFGATNQLLGGLAFLVIAFYLWRRRKPIWFLMLPLVFMLIMPAWALGYQLFVRGIGMETSWLAAESPNWALIVIAIATLVLEVWTIIEAIILFPKAKGVLEGLPAGVGAEATSNA